MWCKHLHRYNKQGTYLDGETQRAMLCLLNRKFMRWGILRFCKYKVSYLVFKDKYKIFVCEFLNGDFFCDSITLYEKILVKFQQNSEKYVKKSQAILFKIHINITKLWKIYINVYVSFLYINMEMISRKWSPFSTSNEHYLLNNNRIVHIPITSFFFRIYSKRKDVVPLKIKCSYAIHLAGTLISWNKIFSNIAKNFVFNIIYNLVNMVCYNTSWNCFS